MNNSVKEIREYMKKNNIDNNLDLNKPIKSLGILKIEKKYDNSLWIVIIRGPKNSYYEKGVFRIEIEFGKNYPSNPPKVKFKNKIVHLQINEEHPCARFLNCWDTTTSRIELIVGLYLLLKIEDQFPQSAYLTYLWLYERDKEQFKKLAQNFCYEFAAPNEEDLILIKRMEEEEENNNINKRFKGLISLIFNCTAKNILCSIICKENDIFVNVECSFYEKYPQFKDTENYFLVNGNKVNKYRTLKENGIKDNDIILINIIDDEDIKENLNGNYKNIENREYDLNKS